MSERKTILKHAGTVLVGQLAVVAFGVTDTIIAGRYDSQALAVLSVSSAIYVTVYVTLLGIADDAVVALFRPCDELQSLDIAIERNHWRTKMCELFQVGSSPNCRIFFSRKHHF